MSPPGTPPRIGSSIDSRDPPSQVPQHRMLSDQETDIQSMPPPVSARTDPKRSDRNNAKSEGGVESYDYDNSGDQVPSFEPPPSTVKAKSSNRTLDLADNTRTPVVPRSRRKPSPIISTTCNTKQPPRNHFSATSTPLQIRRSRDFMSTRGHTSHQAVSGQTDTHEPDSNTTCHTSSSTISSPCGTPFRFTSFPASLPKLNPRTTDTEQQEQSHTHSQHTPLSSGTAKSSFQSPFRATKTTTVRKRMTFAECEFDDGDPNKEGKREMIGFNEDDESHDGHDESHDTSLSSLSGDGTTIHGKTPMRQKGKQNRFRAIQTPFQINSGLGGSGGIQFGAIPESGVTDRAVWLSPILNNEKTIFLDEVVEGEGSKQQGKDSDVAMGSGEDEKVPNPRTKLNFNSMFSPSESSSDAGARKRHSFIDDCQSPQDDTTPARKMANRMNKNPFLTVSDRSKITSFPPPEEDGPLHTGEAQFAPFQIGVSDDDQRYKLSPMEADFRLQLETTECSPIRSVPEDVEMGKSPRNIQKKKRTSAQSPSHNTVMSTNSGQGSTSSATSKSRKLRPLPDMSAFDMGSNATVSSGNHPKSIPVSPMKMHCPPTPLRTPAWAFKNSSLTRSNSLVSTKILAACPPQIIDGFSSLEDSLCVDEKDGQSFNLDANSSALCESFSKDSKSLPPLYENSDQNAKVTSRHGSSKNVFKTIMDSSSEINSSSEEYSAIHLDSSNKQTNQPRLSTDFHQPGAVSFDIDFDNVSLLGSGAFANVYKAKCKSDGQFYAVKQNRRQFRGRRDRERALAEIRIMQRLQNASVSAWREGTEKSKSSYCLYLLFFIRAWQEDGYLFCQTELCCRDTCKHLMLSMTSHWNASSRTYPNIMEDEVMGGQKNEDVQRLVPGNTVWKICHDVACGLSHIHSHNIVHHDIKPLNIFFVYHAKLGALCKIGDFGMAGEIGTCEDGQEGDTAYMPSELLGNAEKQPRGDIFSLGITLYELASSGDWILPREGSRWHAIRDTSHIPELPKTRSPVMVNLVKRMISPNKSDRPTADEILTDNSFLNDSAIQYDKFLADYIRDVNNINAAKELEASEAQNQLTSSRQTPTSMQSKQSADTDRSWNVRTPTPGMMGPFS